MKGGGFVRRINRRVDQDGTVTEEYARVEPVKDARAQDEERRPRWNADDSKIRIFAERLADGRVEFSFWTRPEDNVPQEVIEDYGRLFEIVTHLQPDFTLAPEARDRLRELVRERYSRRDVDRVTAALWDVLRQPAAWREDLSPVDRARYLTACVKRALRERPAHDKAEPGSTTEDPHPGPLAILLQAERAQRIIDDLDPRPEERELLEAIRDGSADTLTEARRVAGLPDSYRVNLIQKARRRRKATDRP